MAVVTTKMSEAVEEYLAYRRPRIKQSTWYQESFVLRRLARDLPDIQIRHLRPSHFNDWFYGPNGVLGTHRVPGSAATRPGVAPSTSNFYRTRIAGFLRYTAKCGLTRIPLLDDVPVVPEIRRVRQQPGAATLISLMEFSANGRDRAYLAMALNSAGRSSDLTGLRVGDVDLDTGWIDLSVPKTEEEDTFPITTDLDTELRRWLIAYAGALGRPLQAEDHLFPARRGSVYTWTVDEKGRKVRGRTEPTWRPDRPVTHTERIVQTALGAVGLPTKYEGTHTLRRAVARALFDDLSAKGGYDSALRQVMATLHHKSSATTERYLGITADKKRRDDRMRGKPFLSAMVSTGNVTPLRRLDAQSPANTVSRARTARVTETA